MQNNSNKVNIYLTTVPTLPIAALAVMVGVYPEREPHGGTPGSVQVEEGGRRLELGSSRPLPLSALATVARAQTHRPVDQVEHQEHDREHHEEHVVHLGPVVLLSHRSQLPFFFSLFSFPLSLEATFLFLPEKIGVTY